MTVTVYCASSAFVPDIYFEATKAMGKILVQMEAKLVYGGGGKGLMGCIAETVLAKGGKVKGIIPRFMMEVEWNHQAVKDMIIVETMSERKRQLLEEADVLLCLPGGTGTFEELFEALTLKRLGKFLKPIIILNTNGYYDQLKVLLNKAISENFMAPKHADMYRFIDSPEDFLPCLSTFPDWDASAINFAAVDKKTS